MAPVPNARPDCPAVGVSHSSRLGALWAVLACGLLAAAGLACADDRKADSGKGNASQDLAVGGQLKEAFAVGFQVGPRSAQAAQERLVQIRNLVPDDPRIDYSQGLVLVRQSQIKQALVQFEAAIAQNGPPLWPAWKAAIWSQFIDNQFEAGLNRLVEFAMLVYGNGPGGPGADEESDEVREFSESQRDAARWIGQLLEALAQLPAAQKYKALIAERETRMIDALGEELALSVDDGRELLRARAQELGLAADVARDTAGQIAKRRKLDKELDAITKDKGPAPETPEEWKKWIDDVLPKFDKQLGPIDREFQSLKQRSDSLESLYAQAGAQLVATKASMSVAHHTGSRFNMPFLKDQLVACNDQMIAYQVEYDVVSGQMSTVAQRAAGIANRRSAAITRYEKETGDTIKKNPDFDKWATWLNAKRPKLAAKAVNNKKSGSDKADAAKKRAPTLKSLMPFDLEHERDEILASFGLRPVAPADGAISDDKSEAQSDRRSALPATQN